MDYKLSVTNIGNGAQVIADRIEADHGADFDAERGDFAVTVHAGKTIEIVAKKVAKGDMQGLASDIELMLDGATFQLSSRESEASPWFGDDLGED